MPYQIYKDKIIERFRQWPINGIHALARGTLQHKNTEMHIEDIQELLDGHEPIAIVRYFERPIFSETDTVARYVLLRMEHGDIHEVPVPPALMPFLMRRLSDFEQVFRRSDGNVWERCGFREKVRAAVPRPKIRKFIDED
ncbi:MAG: hypothetical protein V7724_14050 [Sediminicola sp.]